MLRSMLVALLSVCLVLGGCSGTYYAKVSDPQDNGVSALTPGDDVRVTLKSGQVRHLKVATADHETITGQDLDSKQSGGSTRIAMAEVKSLEVREVQGISGPKTAGLVLGIVAAVAAVAFAAFLISCPSCESD